MTCVITGCKAINGNLEVGGDLHLIGGAYVFNAITNGQGEAAWAVYTKRTYSHYRKEIDFSGAFNMFERRGVLVAPVEQCALNQEAQEYINGGV